MHSTKGTNINHKGLQRTANEYAEERRIYKDLISKNNNVDIKEGETAVYGYNPAPFWVLSVSCWCLAELIFT